MGPHLLVDLSAHGFGHVAQVAPVVNELRRRIPSLRLTLRGAFSNARLQTRIAAPFEFIAQHTDIGMHMASAVDVLIEESHETYRHYHQDWGQKIADEAKVLKRLAPDLVLSNIPYLTLAAAARVGIPAVAMSSLNWADVYQHYCARLRGSAHIGGQILDAYQQGEVFIQLEPALPMLDIARRQRIGPVATLGTNYRAKLAQILGLDADERLVLIAFGGVATRLPLEQWPPFPKVRWLVPGGWALKRADVVAFDALQMAFMDILASADAVITKPGYGTFVEAACNGVPVLFVRRNDWPEEPYLRHWLGTHALADEIDRAQLLSGQFQDALEALLAGPRHAPVPPTGVTQAAAILASWLRR